MRPTYRVILLALIILVFGVAPSVHAFDPDSVVSTAVTCADPPTSWNGEITATDQIDYYSINLLAGQVLTIDVDAEGLSSLDSLLEVFDGAGNPIGGSDDDRAPEEDSVVDPYLEITVDAEDTYYLAISASSKNEGEVAGDEGGNTGSYMLFLQCSEPSNPPGPITDVKVGDLLVTTGSDSGSLISINPDNWESSLRFPLEIGPIADIDYDPISKMLLIAKDTGYPASIVNINPNDDTIVAEFTHADGGFVALEVAGDTLYGVHFYYEDIDTVQTVENYSLVTISQTPDGLTLTPVASLTGHVSSLAYDSSEKILYGVASVSSASDLIKIHLEPEFSIETVGAIQTVGENGQVKVVALDFSHENVLYGVDNSGNVLKIDHANGQAVPIGDPIAGVSGLTFVLGETPPDEEPIKTLCSSTLTSPMTASSATDAPKLSKMKLKNNPLHRAIGLFKFKGRAGETVTFKLAPEVEEAVETGEEYAVSALLEPWLQCKGKGRVFLGVRDAIPNVDFRVRKKDQMPFDMSADLPADGYYYVMVIRPLLRFYKADYCLTLESDHPDSEAWQTLDVVWPGDDSEEDTTLSADAAKLAEPLSDEAGVVADGEPENTTLVNEPLTVTPEEAYTPEPAGETLMAPEAAVDGGSDDPQPTEDAAVDGAGAISSEEPVVRDLREPEPDDAGVTEDGQDQVPASVDQSGGAALEEPAAEIPVEPEPATDSGGDDTTTVETAAVDDSGGEELEEVVAETPLPAADDGGDDPMLVGAPPAD